MNKLATRLLETIPDLGDELPPEPPTDERCSFQAYVEYDNRAPGCHERMEQADLLAQAVEDRGLATYGGYSSGGGDLTMTFDAHTLDLAIKVVKMVKDYFEEDEYSAWTERVDDDEEEDE